MNFKYCINNLGNISTLIECFKRKKWKLKEKHCKIDFIYLISIPQHEHKAPWNTKFSSYYISTPAPLSPLRISQHPSCTSQIASYSPANRGWYLDELMSQFVGWYLTLIVLVSSSFVLVRVDKSILLRKHECARTTFRTRRLGPGEGTCREMLSSRGRRRRHKANLSCHAPTRSTNPVAWYHPAHTISPLH